MYAFKLKLDTQKLKKRSTKLLTLGITAFLTVSKDDSKEGKKIKVRNLDEYEMLLKLFALKRKIVKSICEFNLVRSVNRSF